MTIRHTGLTLLATTSALVALAVASPATAMSPDPIAPVLNHAAAKTWTTETAEEAVADCMAARGFTYIPYVQTVTWTPLVGHPHIALVSEEGGGIDPNKAIVDQLTVGERIEYHLAYWGPDTELDAAGYMVSGPGNSIGPDACVQA